MSYTTHVRGKFTITPPLTWPEIKDSPFASDDWRASDLKLHVDEETVDTEEGTLIRRTASVLAMREIDEYNARNLMSQVQQAVDAFPGHEFTGQLECEGEENSDMWRVVIRDGRAVQIKALIVWPEDGDQ